MIETMGTAHVSQTISVASVDHYQLISIKSESSDGRAEEGSDVGVDHAVHIAGRIAEGTRFNADATITATIGTGNGKSPCVCKGVCSD